MLHPKLESDLAQTLETWCEANFGEESWPQGFMSDNIPLLMAKAGMVILETLALTSETAEAEFDHRMYHMLNDENEESESIEEVSEQTTEIKP